MATTIDLNLEDVHIPNVLGTTVVQNYGKKTSSPTTYLTAQEVINNLQSPYLKARAIRPVEDDNYLLVNIYRNATIVFSTPIRPFSVSLPEGNGQGHVITLVNDTSQQMTLSGVTTGLDNSEKVITAGSATTLYQTATGWRRISAGSLEKAVGILSVKNGGTGVSSFASGELLIGNGTGAVGTRALTDTIADNTNIPTSQAVLRKIQSLDAQQVGGTGLFIRSISETDGVISASSGSLNFKLEGNDLYITYA